MTVHLTDSMIFEYFVKIMILSNSLLHIGTYNTRSALVFEILPESFLQEGQSFLIKLNEEATSCTV